MIAAILSYIKSMRLYYCFVTLTACTAGMVHAPVRPGMGAALLFGLVFFCCWGVNQIVNDYLNLEEDRVNAPDRPMVTGRLPAIPALAASAIILAGIGALALWSNPVSLVAAGAGVMLNILYAYAKAWGIWANITFGLTIACCPWFGYTIAGGGLIGFFRECGHIWLAVLVLNMVMTYFTYFKDEPGDRLAGKRTPVVRMGPERAARAGLLVALVPCAVLLCLPLNAAAAMAGGAGVLLFVLTGRLYFRTCRGPSTYHQLVHNFAALCAAQSALAALAAPGAGLVLCAASVAGVNLIFRFGYRHATE